MYKTFKFTPLDQGKVQNSDQDSAFQVTWPQLESRTYTGSLNQYLKGFEEKVLKQVKEKSYLIEKEAYEKGFAQGEKDGLEMGQKRAEMIAQQLKTILAELEGQRPFLLKVYEKEMVQLVLSISKKIIHHDLQQGEEIIEATLREAFLYMKDRRRVAVHLNPADYQSLLAHSGKDSWIRADQESLRIVEDPAITRGGCLLETPFGDVDATIETQFDEIVSVVWKRFEQSGFFPERKT